MSNKYKNEMDKIVVSDELKERILKAAEKKLLSKESKAKNSKIFYIRYAACCAACLVVLVCGAAVMQNHLFTSDDINDGLIRIDDNNASKPTESEVRTQNQTQTQNQNQAQPNDDKKQNNPDVKKDNGYKTAQVPQTLNTEVKPNDNTIYESTPGNNDNADVAADNETKPEGGSAGDIPTGAGEPSDNKPDDGSGGGVESGYYIEDFNTLADMQKKAGYNFKTPKYLPSGYKAETYSLISGSMVQILYESKTDTIIYRTEQTNADISGDYNIYDKTDTVQTDGVDITVKSNADKCYTAVWNDNASYSISSREGIDKGEMIKIAESVGAEEPDTDLYENDGTDSLFMNKTEENN